jgi:two-component system phosphate regulon response regulator PhoB
MADPMQNSILIIEDEPDIREMLKFSLEAANFTVYEAGDAQQANLMIAKNLPDLILLDWMLPNLSGIKYAKQLKQQELTRDIPIIMLTAKAEEENKVKGLETGADDYITKPFSPRELIARIKTVLRRGPLLSPEGIVYFKNLKLDTNLRKVTADNQALELSPIEYRLLHFFLTHPDRVYTREQLLNHVWGGESYIDERSVDVQILRLRKILSTHSSPSLIHTIHGVGYKFSEEK